MTAVVRLDRVSKHYRLGRERANLRAAVPGAWGARVRGELHRALDDVDLHVEAGESLGVVGRNGAGKSTLLKLVARVSRPTTGRVTVTGRTAALIELGTGFHPDLTGRENVAFSAAVLGMSRRDLAGRFDAIVEFAGIGRYLDTPVKRYSSGMLARLGFAVASHLDADVLVVDEVLSVGDAAFQRRCHERMIALRAEGAALLYVTHALWSVPVLCGRAVQLEGGRVVADGAPADVLVAYSAGRRRPEQAQARPGTAGTSIEVADVSCETAPGEGGLDVTADVDVREPLPDAYVLVSVHSVDMVTVTGVESEPGLLAAAGQHRVRCHLAMPALQPGPYYVYATVVTSRAVPVVEHQRRTEVTVAGDHRAAEVHGLVRAGAEWSVALP